MNQVDNLIKAGLPNVWARYIHYPEHWDTATYPTLGDAISETLAWAGCSACKNPEAYDLETVDYEFTCFNCDQVVNITVARGTTHTFITCPVCGIDGFFTIKGV